MTTKTKCLNQLKNTLAILTKFGLMEDIHVKNGACLGELYEPITSTNAGIENQDVIQLEKLRLINSC